MVEGPVTILHRIRNQFVAIALKIRLPQTTPVPDIPFSDKGLAKRPNFMEHPA